MVRSIDPQLPIYNVRSLKEALHRSSWFYNVFGTVFIVFGVAALFMASVGLYGVLSFSVSRRIQEMGIRMALGAGAKDVVRLVVRDGAVQMGVGLALGAALAYGVSRVVALLMFQVNPQDPMVFGIVLSVIALVGILATWIPARRATKVDPMVRNRCSPASAWPRPAVARPSENWIEARVCRASERPGRRRGRGPPRSHWRPY